VSNYRVEYLENQKSIALVAHDSRKKDLMEWAEFNKYLLSKHLLFATGTTGQLLEEKVGLDVFKLRSGPLGGDQQIGALIAEGRINFVVFFQDPLNTHPHSMDIQALVRIATVYNIPIACNRSSADFMISSPLLNKRYKRILMDYSGYMNRYEGKK